MILYGLKSCDTCRKALKELPAASFCDVRADGVPQEVLARAHAQFGDDLVNRRSTTWRQLDSAQREAPVLDLLAKHPTLMKRPLIDQDGTLFLGWTAAVRSELAGAA